MVSGMQKEYDLEMERAVKAVKESKARLVAVQLPEGLRPSANEIVDALQEQTDAKVIIWMGSCYGACDVPVELEQLGVDLLIQWGHSEWS